MKISDLLKLCSYENIEKEIIIYYGKENLKEYRKLYNDLKNKIIKNQTDKDLYICITARKINDDGVDPAIDIFDENDQNIYFDVSGLVAESDVLYSIASLSFEEFLQCSIEKNTLEKFAYESILAHSFWEITSFDFEDKV